MSCEICGKDIHGRGFKVVVEGAKLTVCKECAELGEPVREERRAAGLIKTHTDRLRKTVSQPQFPRKNDVPLKPRPVAKTQKKPSDEMEELVENYVEIIKKARGEMRIEEFAATLNEKASVLQKIESGKLKPTMKLARRIEKRYRVKLVEHKEEAEDIDDVVWKGDGKKDYSPTLGDFIKKDD